MSRVESTRELVRRVLRSEYLSPIVESYVVTEDVSMDGRCRIEVTLHHEGRPERETIKGEGVGFVDALCQGVMTHYAQAYPSLTTIQFTGFAVRARMDTTRAGTGSDAVGVVSLTVRNSEGTLFEFERQGRSLVATGVAVVLEALEHFVNSERAFISVYKSLQDARGRGRADLVQAYTTQLSELVLTTSYTQVIERIKSETLR